MLMESSATTIPIVTVTHGDDSGLLDKDEVSESDTEMAAVPPGIASTSPASVKASRSCSCPIGVTNAIAKMLFIIVLLVPGLVERLIQPRRLAIAELPLFYWSVFVALLATAFFGYRYLLSAIFVALDKWLPQKLHSKTSQRLALASHLQQEIALVCFGVTSLVIWTVHLQIECDYAKNCKDCRVPRVCTPPSPDAPASWMLKVLGGLSLSSAMYLAEKTLFHLISINFHATAYKDRIDASRFAAWALEKLNEARKQEKKLLGKQYRQLSKLPDNAFSILSTLSMRPSGVDLKHMFDDHPTISPISADSRSPHTDSLNTPQNDSAKGHHSDFLRSPKARDDDDLDENAIGVKRFANMTIKRKTTSKHNLLGDSRENLNEAAFNPSGQFKKASDIDDVFFSSSERAKILARKLFDFLTTKEKPWVVPDDIRPYFDTLDESKRVFEILDKDNSGSVTYEELKRTILDVYKERRRLMTSLVDVENALTRLHHIMLSFMCLVLLFIWLALFDVNITVIFTTTASLLVAIAFVVGSSAKNAFESIVFLFVVHPYDVGDRIFVKLDGPQVENLIVNKLNLLTTVFRRWDGTEIYVPNYIMSTKQIMNIRRSGDQWDPFTIGNICLMAITLVSAWLKNPQTGGRDFHSNFQWWILGVTRGCEMTVQISVQHRKNWQDSNLRWHRRERFVAHVQELLQELDITYSLPTQRIEIQT